MKFSAKDDNNVSYELLPEGDYEFEVEESTLQTAKKGGYQWKVTLRIDPEGKPSRKVWEYFPETEKMEWKFSAFLKCIGLIPVDSEAEFDTELMKDSVGEIGKCRLGIQASDGTYPAKNTVKSFLRPEKTELKEDPKIKINPDDLPF